MKLEFETKLLKISDTIITYEVKRKGLTVGLLILEDPYTLTEARINNIMGYK